MSEKTYEPYFIIVWVSPNVSIKRAEVPQGVAVKEFSYREDAYEKYEELIQRGAQRIALAKLVKKHVEG